MTRRRNPVEIGKHPDLFRGDTRILAEWRELTRKQRREFSSDDFTDDELDEIAEEDQEFFWKIELGGHRHVVQEVLDAGVDPGGVFKSKAEARERAITLQKEAESIHQDGSYVRFLITPIRENPGVPVSPEVQRLAEEAFQHPMGGEWA